MTRTCNGKPAEQVSRELRAFFPASQIEWKVSRYVKNDTLAVMLAYIDARAIQQRLDNVCGPDNWRVSYERWGVHSVLCHLSVRWIDGAGAPEWVTKSDGADDTDVEATKGGISSALKRAASSTLGIGRYLYAFPDAFLDAVPGPNGKPRLKTWGAKPPVPREFLPGSRLDPGATLTPGHDLDDINNSKDQIND